MKQKNTYKFFLVFWLMLPGLMFGNGFLANKFNLASNVGLYKDCKVASKIDLHTNALPFKGETPINNTNENQLFNLDIEEIVESCEVEYYDVFPKCLSVAKTVIIRYNENGNLQFQPGIIPPPPKK